MLKMYSYDDITTWELGQEAEEQVGRSKLRERYEIERGGRTSWVGGWSCPGGGGNRGRRKQGQ